MIIKIFQIYLQFEAHPSPICRHWNCTALLCSPLPHWHVLTWQSSSATSSIPCRKKCSTMTSLRSRWLSACQQPSIPTLLMSESKFWGKQKRIMYRWLPFFISPNRKKHLTERFTSYFGVIRKYPIQFIYTITGKDFPIASFKSFHFWALLME